MGDKRTYMLYDDLYVEPTSAGKFILGVSNLEDTYKLDIKDLKSIANKLKKFKSSDFSKYLSQLLYDNFWIIYNNNSFYIGFAKDNDWLWLKEIKCEDIDGLTNSLENAIEDFKLYSG